MKRILFLILSLNIGGAEHALVEIANRMAEDGFDVTVQTIFDKGQYREKLSPNVHYRKGIDCGSTMLYRITRKLYYTLPAKLLGRLLIKGEYTHLVAFVEGLPTKIIYGFPKKNVKKIAWVHTDLEKNTDTRDTFGTNARNSGCYQAFDKILCVSQDAKAGFEKRIGYSESVLVQYNPMDKVDIIEKSKQKPAYLINPSNAIRLVALGRLSNVKGFDILVEAMEQVVRASNKKVELYIIGGGAEAQNLQRMINERGLQKVVFLCGQQTNPYSIMRQCKIQIVSSRAEGYSLALCEGHFLGLPAVSTKCSGPTEILTSSGGGILVDISVTALANGIMRMINDEVLFSKCKTCAVEWSDKYDSDVIYKQIESLFD